MHRALLAFAGFLLSVSSMGCPAMVPHGSAPVQVQKEGNSDPTSSEGNEDSLPGDPPVVTKTPEYADAGVAKPQQGGVSALPAGVTGVGDVEYKATFSFTLTGTAQQECSEPEQKIRHQATGTVGAVLLDGTVVPLLHCEVLMLRLQTGSDAAARCEDIPVNADCSFSKSVSLRSGVQPKVSLYAHTSINPMLPLINSIPIGDLKYSDDEPLSACEASATDAFLCFPQAVDKTIPLRPNFKLKFPSP